MDTLTDHARSQLLAAMSVLMQRRADTPDPAEKTAITRALTEMNTELDRLEHAELLEAAVAIASAADALERAIGAAKLRPFDTYLRAVEDALQRLEQLGGELHSRESLPSADYPDAMMVAAPAAALPAPPIAGLPPISTSTAFADLTREYEAWYAACTVRPERSSNVDFYVSRVLKFKPTYRSIGAELNGIPWQFIGITHGMVAGFDFSRHLHNGDPLTERTRQAPSGRPAIGNPPFTWRASALDALMLQGLHQVPHWSLARVLYELERFNGVGYRRRGLPTPYLWSFTNLYEKGKYVRDHEFDPEAISEQCGAAAILKGLDAQGAGIGT
jgi:lysozyme family protein